MAAATSKKIPKSKIELVKELKDLFQHNSTTHNFSGRQKLLCSILATEKLRRSSTRGFLFVMGCSGSGKSSTINHIFNFQQEVKTLFAKTSSSKSQTRIVQEYLFRTNSSQYESSDISLGIVDTPGFGDTEGIRQDACNLVAIKEFISTHPDLQGNCPNLILVCFDATDCRYEGPSSGFNKLLKCIKKLEMVDVNKPNLVVVITKSCSLTPHHSQSADSWNENIRQLQMKLKQTVLTTLRILDAPVVILENNYEMESLMRPKMPNGKESDFTQLPNGEKQPLNLFQACSKVFKNNKDFFGQICFNEIFCYGKNLTPKADHNVSPTLCSTHFVLFSPRYNFLNFIEELNQATSRKNIFELEAQKFIKKQKLIGESKSDIDSLISDINDCAVLEYLDFKLISINILEYYLKKDLKNIETEFLLAHLKLKEFPADDNLSEIIQSGYHIFSDSFRKQIFKGSPQMLHGIFIPESFSLENICEREYFAEYSKDKAELIAKRIQLLNGVKMKVKEDEFEFNRRPGFQIVSNQSDMSVFDFEFYEKRYFKVVSTSGESKLSSNFINAVKKLPNIYNSKNSSLFNEFFEEFGHYFILSVYVGGSYERTGKKSECNGGDPTFANATITEKNRTKWETSVLNYPQVLSSEMKLEPISTAVGQVDVEKKEAVGLALSDLFHHCELGANEGCGFESSLPVDDEEDDCWTREEAVDLEMSTGFKVLFGFLSAIGVILSLPLLPITIPVAIGFTLYAIFGDSD